MNILFFCITSVFFFFVVIILASSIKVVPENKRMVVHRLGRRIGELGPGLVLVIPFVDKGEMIDLTHAGSDFQQDGLIPGAIGNAVTDVYREGQIEVNGKNWDAISDEFIREGEQVRVKKVILNVERV